MLRRILTVAVGALAFFGYCVAVAPKNDPRIHWYQYPVVLPIEAGVAAGGNPHNVNGPVVIVVLFTECLVAGFILDLAVTFVRSRSPKLESRGESKG